MMMVMMVMNPVKLGLRGAYLSIYTICPRPAQVLSAIETIAVAVWRGLATSTQR